MIFFSRISVNMFVAFLFGWKYLSTVISTHVPKEHPLPLPEVLEKTRRPWCGMKASPHQIWLFLLRPPLHRAQSWLRAWIPLAISSNIKTYSKGPNHYFLLMQHKVATTTKKTPEKFRHNWHPITHENTPRSLVKTRTSNPPRSKNHQSRIPAHLRTIISLAILAVPHL